MISYDIITGNGSVVHRGVSSLVVRTCDAYVLTRRGEVCRYMFGGGDDGSVMKDSKKYSVRFKNEAGKSKYIEDVYVRCVMGSIERKSSTRYYCR